MHTALNTWRERKTNRGFGLKVSLDLEVQWVTGGCPREEAGSAGGVGAASWRHPLSQGSQ